MTWSVVIGFQLAASVIVHPPHSSSWPNDVPLYGQTIIYSSTHQLIAMGALLLGVMYEQSC